LSLQKCRIGKDVCDLEDLIVDFLSRLEQLLTAVDVEHEGHDVLWQVLSYFGKLR
jgi:hypothetical protein